MSSQFVNLPASGGGSGAVDSVNGQTGVVVLDATDVGAASVTLDNLGTTLINASLLFDTDQLYDIGSGAKAAAVVYAQNYYGATGTGLQVSAQGGRLALLANSGQYVSIQSNGATGVVPLRIYDGDSSAYVSITVPTVVTASYALTLPPAVASAGQVLTDVAGDGILSWETVSGGGGSPGGSNGQFQYNNSGAFGGASNVTLESVAGENILKMDSVNSSTVAQFGDALFVVRSGNTSALSSQVYYDHDVFKRATGDAGSILLFVGDSVILYQTDAGVVGGTPAQVSPFAIESGGVFKMRGSTIGGASSGYVWTLINAGTGECGWLAP